MRLFFFSSRQMSNLALVLLLLLIAGVGLFGSLYQSQSVTVMKPEAIYQGAPQA